MNQSLPSSVKMYRLSTPTEHPQNSLGLYHLQQASRELPLCPLDCCAMFCIVYFICQSLITAYSVKTAVESQETLPCKNRLNSPFSTKEVLRDCYNVF